MSVMSNNYTQSGKDKKINYKYKNVINRVKSQTFCAPKPSHFRKYAHQVINNKILLYLCSNKFRHLQDEDDRGGVFPKFCPHRG